MRTNAYPRVLLFALASMAWPAWGDIGFADASSTLALTEFEILPSAGTVHFISPISLRVIADTFSSRFGSDHQFTHVNDAVASVTSGGPGPSFATGTGSALRFTGAVTGMAASWNNGGPCCSNSNSESEADASSEFDFGFEILGASGPVNVQFIANINYAQSVLAGGAYDPLRGALSSVYFVGGIQQSDGTVVAIPVFLGNTLQSGPLGSDSSSFSGPVSGNATIEAGAPFNFTLGLQTYDHGLVPVPEPAWIVLLLPALTLLFLRRRLSGADN